MDEYQPVKLTNTALSQIKEVMAKENITDKALRIGVSGGGCSGLQYVLDFTDACEDTDFIYEEDGIKIAVDQYSAGHLNGTTIDYVDGLNGSGFRFDNPNAERKCGCGSSFS